MTYIIILYMTPNETKNHYLVYYTKKKEEWIQIYGNGIYIYIDSIIIV